jgi:hypothetical protein
MSAYRKSIEAEMLKMDIIRRRGCVFDIEKAEDGIEALKDELCQTIDFHYPALREAFQNADTLEIGRIIERTWFGYGDRCYRANLAKERMQDQETA